MLKVSATDFARNFGKHRVAVQREPIAVTSHDTVAGYFVSAEDFADYERMKALKPKAYFIHELPDEFWEALDKSDMDSRHDPLNALLDAK